ncbi:hypothetical protein ACHAPJ_012625 [Fusarium lateritium]
MALLNTWIGEIFPQYAKAPLYIAGESFGGQYVPRYAADVIREKQARRAGALQDIALEGIILVDAVVDATWLSIGHYDLFCTDTPPNVVRFNATSSRQYHSASDLDLFAATPSTGMFVRQLRSIA